MVAGPTGCGKTQFTGKFVRHAADLMVPAPVKIIWIYGQYQSAYDEFKGFVDFKDGLDALDDLPTVKSVPTLLILDDVMDEADARVTKLFTKGSHHLNLSVMFLVQNLFNTANKEHRTISLNAHYVVLFKNPRDARQIEHLANQMYPGKTRFLREAFADAASSPYAYILLDLKQTTPDRLRVRTDIFRKATSGGVVGDLVYVPK